MKEALSDKLYCTVLFAAVGVVAIIVSAIRPGYTCF